MTEIEREVRTALGRSTVRITAPSAEAAEEVWAMIEGHKALLDQVAQLERDIWEHTGYGEPPADDHA